jgi:hypothetical protein
MPTRIAVEFVNPSEKWIEDLLIAVGLRIARGQV